MVVSVSGNMMVFYILVGIITGIAASILVLKLKESMRNSLSDEVSNTNGTLGFGQIIENLSSEIFIFDIDTLRVLNVNQAGRENLGYSLAELITMYPTDINPETKLNEIKSFVAPLKDKVTDKVILETVHRRKDGTSYDVEVNLQLADHLGKKAIIANVFDISKRKKSETFIRAKSDFLSLILEKSPSLIFVKDQEFNIVEANEKLLELYPEDMRDSVIGTTTIESYTKEDREAFLENDRIAFDEGYSEVTETVRMPSGDTLTLYTQKVRFEDSNGTPFILGISVDVSERESLINKLAESNEELERFAYVCSHDLQEPLRMIQSFSDRLKVHLHDTLENDPKGQKYFNFVTDGAERSRQLIADILSYSSLSNNPQRLETFEVDELIGVVSKNLTLQLDEKSAKITYDILPVLKGNKTQIFQLFQNLIYNGLKYQLPEKHAHVHVGVKDLGTHYQFEIRDNGIGIEPKYLNKIFEVFQRLHKRHEFSGTGVGLAICKKIVEQHGGKIWAESELGKGASFFFTVEKLAEDTISQEAA